MEQRDFIIVEWSGGKRRLYKAKCDTCSADRGYKKSTRLKGNCKSCQGKINAGTLGIVKQCISCQSTNVPDPGKQWFAGPTCYRCYGKEYRQNNKEAIRTNIDKWRETNREKHKASEIQWRQDNKEHKTAMDNAWRRVNKIRARTSQREYVKHKLKTNPCFKIACALRHRLNEALKTNQKVGSAVRDLGCSIEEFKWHLEAKFHHNPQTGTLMTWDNHMVRGWHIDHIKPLVSFDLTDRTQFLAACHYTNMQPLWGVII